MRQRGNLWLWLIISRLTRQVLGFALGDRSQQALEWAWEDVPLSYCPLPIKTDGWKVYASFFEGIGEGIGHEVCDKGSGKTSIVEALNTHYGRRGRRM